MSVPSLQRESTNSLIYIYIYMQSISPGVVRTEFAQRMIKDVEQGEKMYDQLVDGVSSISTLGTVHYLLCLPYCSH